jgi:biotin transport system permease protein
MIALYRPGTSPIHRLPAGIKILLFIAITLAITMVAQSIWVVAIAALVVVVFYFAAGLSRQLPRQVVAVRWLIAVTLVTQLIFLPPLVAATNTGRVLVVVVFAALISLTTRVSALLDMTERVLGPFRRFGVSPSGIGLVLAMTITAIPVIGGFASTIREAQRARGVPVRLTTFVVPLLVMSLKHSDDLADALAARGAE